MSGTWETTAGSALALAFRPIFDHRMGYLHMTTALAARLFAALLTLASVSAFAQWNVGSAKLQVHGFLQQGFAVSDGNNFLTMKTEDGSFRFTDGGLNISLQLNPKFRLGAQAYSRSIGELGHGHLELDWAYGDYKFTETIGLRAGKVKTALGLYNDTQDMEFLHTWALLPQSAYPLDLRSSTIAHTGGDLYGQLGLRKAGSLAYTAYAGTRPDDRTNGLVYNAADQGNPISKIDSYMAGYDLRWNSPVSGLTLGSSWCRINSDISGTITRYANLPYHSLAQPWRITSAYADYTRGPWHFSGEFRRNNRVDIAYYGPASTVIDSRDKSVYATASYRLRRWLELGTYHSRLQLDHPLAQAPGSDHIRDQAITARFDLNRFTNIKIEGHFMDGIGDTYSSHGFYNRSNPAGFQKATNLLVIRAGFSF